MSDCEDATGQLSYEDAYALVVAGNLPADFNQWELADALGGTVAHLAVLYDCLPIIGPHAFDQWELADIDGWTVAHQAARWGGLPDDFCQWDLTNQCGTSVAHVAASSGHLSANFSQWGKVVGLQRVTVLRLVLDEDRSVANGDDIRFLEEIMRRWDKEKPLCETDADWEVFKQELPEVYCRYAVNEVMPDVPDEVSHGVRL